MEKCGTMIVDDANPSGGMPLPTKIKSSLRVSIVCSHILGQAVLGVAIKIGHPGLDKQPGASPLGTAAAYEISFSSS
jgi:hypothetical protein